MTTQDDGSSRAPTRVILIALFGMLFVGLALLATRPSGAISAGQLSIDKGNLASPSSPSLPNEMCWQLVASPNQGGYYYNYLYGVAVVSPNDIWAVGYYGGLSGGPDRTLVEHWNGTAWVVVPSPDQGDYNHLSGVAAVGANDVWAVGAAGSSYGRPDRTLVEHWNGTAWAVVPSPNPGSSDNYLSEVAVVSPSDVWAVGYYANGGVDRTLVEHWNGSTWSAVSSPNQNTSNNGLRGVAVVSPSDVWAVGYYFDQVVNANQTLVEHWNGSAWSVVSSPNRGTTPNRLSAVSAVSANDVWAVGDYYSGSNIPYQTLVEHWNGSAWSVVSSPNQGAYRNYLSGVAAVGANDVWAVGLYDNGSMGQALVQHWNGTGWSVVSSPNPGSAYNVLIGVAAVSASDVWAVGGDDDNSMTSTLVERYNTCPASPTPTPCTAGQFSDVHPGSTFYRYIICLANRGIIGGYPDCSFKPNNNVTRGQLAKIVSNASGFSDPQTTQLFQDVPVGSTFFQYVGRLASRGYMSGYACGGPDEQCVPPSNLPYFRPNNKATRGQLTKIVSNAAGFQDAIPTSVQTFTDLPPNSTFWLYVERLLLNRPDVMGGYVCGGANEPCDPQQRPYFRPANYVTRGQTSKIVANTFFPNCQSLAPGK